MRDKSGAILSEISHTVIMEPSADSDFTRLELKKAEELCKDYISMKSAYEDAEKEINELHSALQMLPEGVEKLMVIELLEKKNALISSARTTCILFEIALLMMEQRDRHLVSQLYVEGKKWDDLRGLDGTLQSRYQISRSRKRALETVAGLLRKLNKLKAEKNRNNSE